LKDLVDPGMAVPPKPPEPRVVAVPDQFVSKVVGYQGCTLKEIQLATQTYIHMDQSTIRQKGYAVAMITGQNAANLDAAENFIKTRIEQGLQTQRMYAAGKHGMGKGGRIQMGLGII